MRIHYFQHVPFEGPACIADWAKAQGHEQSFTRWYEHPHPPAPSQTDMLVIMGGPMGVYEEDKYPWLAAEKAYIRSCIDAGKPVLGICLGAQLIASVLGARVYPNDQKEIGWFPVQFHADIAPSPTTVLHWHGDTFDLPENAQHLAETPVCRNQAYIYREKVIGMQFHFEITMDALEGMIRHCGHELIPAACVQSAADIRAGAHHIAHTNELMFRLLDRLEKLV